MRIKIWRLVASYSSFSALWSDWNRAMISLRSDRYSASVSALSR